MLYPGVNQSRPNHNPRAGWEEKTPPRDPTTHQLRGDARRFPSGMKALGDYVHNAGLSFAMYTAESSETCGGYPASKDYEMLDAQTFASWGVDYLKVSSAFAPFRSFFFSSPNTIDRNRSPPILFSAGRRMRR